MLLNFITNNGNLLLLAIMHLFFLQGRYIPIIVANLAILACYFCGINKMICLEISSLLSIYSITLNNHRFKIPSIISVIIFSCGCFLLAIYEINKNLIIELLSAIPNIEAYSNLVQSIYLLVVLLMIVGFIPFIEWNMYLFSISSSLFKVITLITPMFLSLQVMRELNLQLLPNSYQIIGLIVCIYSCFCIAINSNLRLMLMYVITYFYGIDIMFIPKTLHLYYVCEPWMIVCFCVLLLSNTFTPTRTIKYKIQNIRDVLNNKFGVLLFLFSLTIILYCFINVFFLLPLKNEYVKIAPASLFSVFFAKFLANAFNKEKKNAVVAKKDLSKYRLLRMTFGNILLLLICIFNIYQHKHISYQKNLLLLVSSLIIFLLFLSLMLIIKDWFQLTIKKNRTYSYIIVIFIRFIKIVSLIIKNIFVEFISTIKKQILKLTISSMPQKLSNILYGQHVYFYIFFLIQVIVVLTIECVIL